MDLKFLHSRIHSRSRPWMSRVLWLRPADCACELNRMAQKLPSELECSVPGWNRPAQRTHDPDLFSEWSRSVANKQYNALLSLSVDKWDSHMEFQGRSSSNFPSWNSSFGARFRWRCQPSTQKFQLLNPVGMDQWSSLHICLTDVNYQDTSKDLPTKMHRFRECRRRRDAKS